MTTDLQMTTCGCVVTAVVMRRMLEQDPTRLGNRGSHRYSFGNSCAYFGAQKEFAVMIGLYPIVTLENSY
jgi:hypothetical protein